jgi:ATP-dependent DNA helicase RecG
MTQPLSLSDGVQYVKGVGPARARLLEKLGVKTVADLLWLFPREYVDLREVKNVADLEEDQSAIVRGTVVYRKAHTTKAGVPVLEIECRDRTGVLAAVWFHRPDLSGAIVMGQEIQLTGKVKCVDTVWRMTNPKVRSAVDAPETPGVVPIYAMTEGLRADEIRAICRQALAVADQMPDLLPESFRVARGWMSAGQALRKLHEPRDIDEAESARRRLVYEEFLQFQLAFGVKRRAFAQRRGRIIQVSTEVDQRIRRLFGFLLTADQDAAIAELVDDLRGPGPMHRLVQGDVGTGKTAVAVYAILAVIAAGYQTAYMAPTEILARQQFRLLDDMLRQSRVRRRFLVGGLLPAE